MHHRRKIRPKDPPNGINRCGFGPVEHQIRHLTNTIETKQIDRSISKGTPAFWRTRVVHTAKLGLLPMASTKMRSRLLRREGHLCGIHLGGCRRRINSIGKASVDHIFTRSFFREFDSPADVNGDWNCQPMHPNCNEKRGGQIYGFPLFSCECHWLRIGETSEGHEVVLCYRNEEEELEEHVVCAAGKGITRTKIYTGKFADDFGGATEMPIQSIGTMGNLPPGQKGATGIGNLGHKLPTIEVDEVPEFNRRELFRVKGVSAPTIEGYNKRIPAMEAHFIVGE